jgi:Flp pilus assembly protein TadD
MDYRLEQLRFELREDPSSRSFFKLGEHLRREGEHDEAIDVLRTGLEHHPRYVAAWVSLGRALLAAGQGAEAAVALDTALELDPGNAVAARAAGEAGIANEEWVKAVKALKLARGLTPQDDSLDERIVFVETKLGERGELEAPEPAPQPPEEPLADVPDDAAAENPFAVQPTARPGVWSAANDVFEAGWVADEDVAQVAEDDSPDDATGGSPHPVEDAGDADTGAGDIFEVAAETIPSPAIMIDDADEPPEPESNSEPEPEPEPEPESEPRDEHEHEPEPAAAPDPEPVPATDDESAPDPDIPVPTMTLAQLAISQGDLDLAEHTLRGVLESEPENREASRLLESLQTVRRTGPEVAERSEDPATGTTQKLRRWLDTVRLASERLGS